jgi:signal transduction histidine kinase
MKAPPLTIRQRLTLVISFSALLILVLEGWYIYDYSIKFYEWEFRGRLEERLFLADSLLTSDRLHPFTAISKMPPGYLPDEKILYLSKQGHSLSPINDNFLPEALDTTRFHSNFTYFEHIGQRDFCIRHDPKTHETLVVSAIDKYGYTKIQNLRYAVLSGIGIGVVLLSLISWFWVKRMLQPIADKIKKARAIGAKSLNLRLDVKNEHDELGQMGLAFNEMLDRIENAFVSQQHFIRNAAHEMRTPLTAITAEADLALLKERASEQYRTSLASIRQRSENLSQLTHKLLAMSGLESDSLLPQPCATDEVLLSAVKTIKSTYPEGGQHINIRIEAPTAMNLQVFCDPAMLETAYLNLIDNAVKYSNQKEVLVRLFNEPGTVCLEVIDKGDGIAEQEMEHLFKPFYRSIRHRGQNGSGIGLSLVNNIAEKYGGKVRIWSHVGVGSRVQFDLPAMVFEKLS